MNIKELIQVLTTLAFVLESLDKKNQITFSSGNKITLSELNSKRVNFVYQNPEYQNNTANLMLYGHKNKNIVIHVTDEYEDNKRIMKVVFQNDEKTHENYFVLKSLV